MIVLRFGKSGRLAQICETAIKLAIPSAIIYTANREGEFLIGDGLTDHSRHKTLDSLLQVHPSTKLVLLDTSVDHRSTTNLIAHETFKREVIASLDRRNALSVAIGFSSGITLVDAHRISDAAPHMLEYRNQKLAQESLFGALTCPVFLPNIFTLVGPITYAAQGAAWAQILRARLLRSSNVELNEPQAKKAWTSEFQVFKSVFGFLTEKIPDDINGPLVDGVFTLSDIASGAYLPIPALAYSVGSATGWLNGDYLPPAPITEHHSIGDELIRALYP